MATHIDPFAPGDSPQHPANWKPNQKEEHFTPQAVQASVEHARRINDLKTRHVLPTEIERRAPVTVEELERREQLAQDYLAGLRDPANLDSPIGVYIEDEDATYRYDEEHGWVPVPTAHDDPQGPPENGPDADPLAAALAALDAVKGQ